MQRRRFGRDRAVDIERPQHPPGPGQSVWDRGEMAPDKVDHLDPEHPADVGEDRRDLAACGGFGDGRDRIASTLTHSENTGRRLSLARMVWAGLVQTNGCEDLLCSRM